MCDGPQDQHYIVIGGRGAVPWLAIWLRVFVGPAGPQSWVAEVNRYVNIYIVDNKNLLDNNKSKQKKRQNTNTGSNLMFIYRIVVIIFPIIMPQFN